MIDARRMEVYTAIFNTRLTKLDETKALILEPTSFDQFLKTSACHFIGDGAGKSEGIFKRKNSSFTPSTYPSAKVMAQCVEQAYKEQKFQDTAYFEPYYLKNFVDGKKTRT